MDAFFKFLTEYKDALGLLFGSGFFLVLMRFVASIFARWRQGRLRVEIKSLDVVVDPATLLPRLYGEENKSDILAHHRIPYQRRDLSRDVQAELRAVLNETRYLLITARTGMGKTREAALLASSLMNEGWRVLRVKTGWLDIPKGFPAELGSDRRRIVILLDDLNGLFRAGAFMQSPQLAEMPMFTQSSFHDRLLGFLNAFEEMCGEHEIRVIATARDEANEWKVMDFSQRDLLWKRFKRVELPEPSEDAITELLEETVAVANVPTERADLPSIARQNDGTFANVVLNLQRARNLKLPLSRDNYTATLEGSWREVYARAVRQHPGTRFIYDALDLLSQANIDLTTTFVEHAAMFLADRRLVQLFDRFPGQYGGPHWNFAPPKDQSRMRWTISMILFIRRLLALTISMTPLAVIQTFRALRAIDYLVDKEKILAMRGQKFYPRDGQIEAKGYQVDWRSYTTVLEWILIPQLPAEEATASMRRFASILDEAGEFEQAAVLWAELAKSSSTDPFPWLHCGMSLMHLKRYTDAEDAFRHAVDCQPQNKLTQVSFAIAESLLKKFAEAEAACRKAIDLDPKYFLAYHILTSILSKGGRRADMEAVFLEAVKQNPDNPDAYKGLGDWLAEEAGRSAGAEEAYQQALRLSPNDAPTYHALGSLAKKMQRLSDSEVAYLKAIELDPVNSAYSKDLADLMVEGKRYDEAEATYRKAITLDPNNVSAYGNLGILLGECLDRHSEAEAAYRQAIELNPQLAQPYNNLGLLLHEKLQRYPEAERLYRKAIELDPNYATAYNNLGRMLHFELNRFLEAQSAYSKACELEPNVTGYHYGLARLLHGKLGRFLEAETAYRQTIACAPNEAIYRLNLGLLLHYNLQRYEEAEVAYRNAIGLDPSIANVYYHLGILLHYRFLRLAEAEIAYRKAIDLDPDYAAAYCDLGTLLRVYKRFDQAMPLLERSQLLAPRFISLLNLAGIHKQLNDPIKSAEYLAEARQWLPTDDWYDLACFESLCGNLDQTIEYLKRAAQKESFFQNWAWQDPDLEWIRRDPRFQEIVGDPLEKGDLANLGPHTA